MPLRFIHNGSTRVETGSNASQFPDICTILAWIFPTVTDATYQAIVERTYGDFSDYRGLGINSASGSLGAFMRRGSPGFTGADVNSNANQVVANKWQFVGCHLHGSTSTGTDEKLFYGHTGLPIGEITVGYANQDAGSGSTSPGGNSQPTVIGNNSTNAEGFPGLIHWVGMWSGLLAIDQMRYWQRVTQSGRIIRSANNTLFMYLGGSTGRQRDYSGANNHGTITGALPTGGGPSVRGGLNPVFLRAEPTGGGGGPTRRVFVIG